MTPVCPHCRGYRGAALTGLRLLDCTCPLDPVLPSTYPTSEAPHKAPAEVSVIKWQDDAPVNVCVQYGPGGWFIEWYRDDAGSEGCGDAAEVALWYGTRETCEERAKSPPDPSWWVPAHETWGSAPPYDAATATGMYDAW